jgi:hypothetical protein
MQPYSDYEIAQRRIQERQRKKTQFRASLLITILVLLLTFLGHDVAYDAVYCTIPLAVITGLFAVANWIELYYTATTRSLNATEIEQEMEWLFGDKWQEQANIQSYALAQDRIRKRRINKWRFLGHTLFFIPINALLTLAALSGNSLDNYFFAIVVLIWLGLFITHAVSAVPRKRWLVQREMDYGRTIQSEMMSLQPEKMKVREKLKRGKYYQVGDDGELEEVKEEILRLEDKPKRESDGA